MTDVFGVVKLKTMDTKKSTFLLTARNLKQNLQKYRPNTPENHLIMPHISLNKHKSNVKVKCYMLIPNVNRTVKNDRIK